MHVRPRLRHLVVLGLAGLALAAVGVTAAQSKPLHSTATTIIDGTTDGDYSVTFNLKTPQSTWPFILTTGAGTIVDHKVYPADKIVANTDTKNLVGTGPYVLSKFTPGQQAVFTPNPNYDGSLGSVKNGGVIINYYSKSSTMKLALQQGTIDMAFRDFTPTEYAALGTTSGITVFKGSGVVIRYLVLNVKRAPTNNVAMR